jgi:hypothetical protein
MVSNTVTVKLLIEFLREYDDDSLVLFQGEEYDPCYEVWGVKNELLPFGDVVIITGY